MRKYRITVGSGSSGFDVSNLRCTFKIEKQVDETPNYSEVAIYNLAYSTVALIKPGATVTIEAGYENGNFGSIFTGQVVQPYSVREDGIETKLVLVCQDSGDYLNQTFTNKTLQKGSTHGDVIHVCTDTEKITLGHVSKEVEASGDYIRGKVLFGNSAEYVSKVAVDAQAQMYVDDGVLNIVTADDYSSNSVIELNPDTGLVGDPSQTDDGVSAQCLINPSIRLNTLIHIDSSYITQKALTNAESEPVSFSANGTYKVIKLTYEGDTHGDPWYCNIDAIAQDSAQPAGAVASGASGEKPTESNTTGSTSGTVSTVTPTGEDKSVLQQLFDKIISWR